MFRRLALVGLCAVILTGCGIPPVDTTYVSREPASAQDFAVARRAVEACTDPRRSDRMRAAFERAGFTVSDKTEALRNGRTITRMIVDDPRDRVSVLVGGGDCFVGLVGMTPRQSAELAQIWVRAHQAQPNSAFGDGLSDHVSGAWRRFFTEPPRFPDKAAYRHRIYIAAYKTWPHGPYDPQRGFGYDLGQVFPDTPGAAVKLDHVFECQPMVETGPNRGVFLPCSGPVYRPNE